MSEQHWYRIAGLAVRSEIALPGLITQAPQPAADVIIRRDDVPASLDGAEVVQHTFQIAGERFLFLVPDVARYLLTGGRDIAVAAETADDELAAFLIGTVFGILLHQRKQIVLHASSIRVKGHAVLFCGASGAGKSTLTAALCKDGYAMLTDDVCAIAHGGDGSLLVQPDARQLKLWAHAIQNLELEDGRRAPVRNRIEKFFVEPRIAAAEPLPLGAIYVLRESRPPITDGIHRPNLAEAALQIMANAYRPRLAHIMNQRQLYLDAAASICAESAIYYLDRAMDFAVMPQVIEQLEQHWAEIGRDWPAP